MSTQWWLHTSTLRTSDQVLAFLATLPGAGPSTEFPERGGAVVELDGRVLASVYAPPRGTVASNRPTYGFGETLCVVLNRVRGVPLGEVREAAYRAAFAFARWDEDCDLRFVEGDAGVFARLGRRHLVNARRFEGPRVREFLPTPAEVADPPGDDLERDGWPPTGGSGV